MSRFSSGQIRVYRERQDFEKRHVRDFVRNPIIAGIKPQEKRKVGIDITNLLDNFNMVLPRIRTKTEEEKNKDMINKMLEITNKLRSTPIPAIPPLNVPQGAPMSGPPRIVQPLISDPDRKHSPVLPTPIPTPIPIQTPVMPIIGNDRINLLRLYDVAINSYNNGLDISPLYNSFRGLANTYNRLMPLYGAGLYKDPDSTVRTEVSTYYDIPFTVNRNRFEGCRYNFNSYSQLEKYAQDDRTVLQSQGFRV